MLNIEFFNAKNNSQTCRIDNVLLHSAYNPENEAKKIIESLNCGFVPKFFLIFEPGLNYVSQFIKNLYPDSKICIIRYSAHFNEYNSFSDKTIYYDPDNIIKFKNEINSFFGEDGILYTQFVQIQSTAKVFFEQSESVWRIIKECVELAQTILNTNGFFAKRWLHNSISFLHFLKNAYLIKKGNSDILITASGISLENSIKQIKRIRNEIFLIAVSSSLSPLLNSNIIPDLVISTDGGFWAKKHLNALLSHPEIPVAISAESNCHKKILQQNRIIPLYYSDGTGSSLLKHFDIPCMKAARNGTVSGTAIELALSLTDGNIFICGLDLAGSESFQHTNPNEIELDNCSKDIKIHNSETRQTTSRFNSGSLKIYEKWFTDSSERFYERVFRLSDNFKYSNKLGKIQDLCFNDIKTSKGEKPVFVFQKEINIKENDIQHKLHQISESDSFKKELFPIEFLSLSREKDESQKNKLSEQLAVKTADFIEKLL